MLYPKNRGTNGLTFVELAGQPGGYLFAIPEHIFLRALHDSGDKPVAVTDIEGRVLEITFDDLGLVAVVGESC